MIRKNILQGSWYPDNKNDIESILSEWTEGIEDDDRVAGIVPHAGWYFSGKTAAQVLKKTIINKDLVVVIGGHLPAGSDILAAFEDKISTPSGAVLNRIDIIDKLRRNIQINEDIFSDNTVEIVLAMVSCMAPETDVVWLRAPADLKAVMLADEIFNITEEYGYITSVIGSTDLTHYGRNYSFTPAGTGKDAIEWVRDVNDAGIIRYLLDMNYEKALIHANRERSACSIGAAAAAVRFAELKGVSEGVLVDYHTSLDVHPAESFVGYAGIVY